jgi:hypothetical protein
MTGKFTQRYPTQPATETTTNLSVLFSRNDRNIISHVAPVSGRCYNLDDNAGAYFYNTAGFLQSYCKSPSASCQTKPRAHTQDSVLEQGLWRHGVPAAALHWQVPGEERLQVGHDGVKYMHSAS